MSSVKRFFARVVAMPYAPVSARPYIVFSAIVFAFGAVLNISPVAKFLEWMVTVMLSERGAVLAAWVQGVGTIAAVFLGAWLSGRAEARRFNEQKRSVAVMRIHDLSIIANKLVKHCELFRGASKLDDSRYVIMRSEISSKRIDVRLLQIDRSVDRLLSGESVRRLLIACDSVNQINDKIDSVFESDNCWLADSLIGMAQGYSAADRCVLEWHAALDLVGKTLFSGQLISYCLEALEKEAGYEIGDGERRTLSETRERLNSLANWNEREFTTD